MDTLSAAAAVALVLLALHLVFRVISPCSIRFTAFSDAQTLVPLRHSPDDAGSRDHLGGHRNEEAHPLCVAVTGGVGFLGGAIVRQLASRGTLKIRVLDAHQPPEGRLRGVEYVDVDLVADDPTKLLVGVDAVIHVAGVVGMRASQAAHLHNVHVVATRKLVRAARLAGVRMLVATSSTAAVTSPYCTASQLRLPSEFMPAADFPFANAYSKTKFAAERIALAANDPRGFAVVALRLPGLYGVGDRTLVDALLSGKLTHAPAGRDGSAPTIDFCYVENAAHAHCVALDALCQRRSDIAGSSFNVSDGEAETRPAFDIWNLLLVACAPQGTAPRVVKPLPYAVAYVAACIFELVDWFLVGRVPFPRAPMWGLTRASLGFATTPITLQLSPALRYTPLYTTQQAFAHIAKQWRART